MEPRSTCPACGYERADQLSSGICPECGNDKASLEGLAKQRRFIHIATSLYILTFVTCLAVVLLIAVVRMAGRPGAQTQYRVMLLLGANAAFAACALIALRWGRQSHTGMAPKWLHALGSLAFIQWLVIALGFVIALMF